MSKLSQLIVETFEKERPDLCRAIKQAVTSGESRSNFERFAKSVINDKQGVLFPLCLTVFDHYSEALKK